MEKSVYVGGVWTEGQGDWFEKRDPATDEIAWQGHAATRAQVDVALSTARSAQPGWARLPQTERTTILERYADEIARRSDDIAYAISRDMGKTLWESRAEAGAMKAKVAISIKAQTERAGRRRGLRINTSDPSSTRRHGGSRPVQLPGPPPQWPHCSGTSGGQYGRLKTIRTRAQRRVHYG